MCIPVTFATRTMENVLKAIEEMSQKFDALKEDMDYLKHDRERNSHDWAEQDPGHQRSQSRNPILQDPPRSSGLKSLEACGQQAHQRRSWPSEDPYEEEATDEADLMEFSDETHSFLSSACTRSLSDGQRKCIRGRYQLPKVVATKSPNIDAFMKTETSATLKANDRELSRTQSFVLGALAPLTTIIEKVFTTFTQSNAPPT